MDSTKGLASAHPEDFPAPIRTERNSRISPVYGTFSGQLVPVALGDLGGESRLEDGTAGVGRFELKLRGHDVRSE